MKKIITYLIIWLVASMFLFFIHYIIEMPCWYIRILLFAQCAFMGAIGGIFYCLRAIYINKCILKRWDKVWEIWYYLRPIVSAIGGFISCIFVKAGMLALDASNNPEAVSFGYLAIAFVAGYNVDNFIKRIENLAHTTWGIEKSGASKIKKPNNEDESK